MPDIYEVARSFARAVRQRERQAARQMVEQYRVSERKIRTQVARLETEMKKEKSEDERGRIRQKKERLEHLSRQIEQEIVNLNGITENLFSVTVQEARQAGAEHAARLIEERLTAPAVGPTFAGLPVTAVERAVAFGVEGSPLRDLLEEASAGTADRIVQELAHSVATGRSAKKTAAAVRRIMGSTLTRAMTIGRTETLRAYREATRATYDVNSDIVRGWIWTANLSVRTCAMCLAMDGKLFPVAEPLGTHPNCRCTMVPVVKGLPVEDQLPKTTGVDYVNSLSPEELIIVLGRKKAELYSQGVFELEDLIGFRRDRRWGPVRWEKPLSALNA